MLNKLPWFQPEAAQSPGGWARGLAARGAHSGGPGDTDPPQPFLAAPHPWVNTSLGETPLQGASALRCPRGWFPSLLGAISQPPRGHLQSAAPLPAARMGHLDPHLLANSQRVFGRFKISFWSWMLQQCLASSALG